MEVVVASSDRDLRQAVDLLVGESIGDTVVGTTSQCGGVLALVRSTRPDTVVLDWEMICEDAVNIVTAIRAEAPSVRIVALGTSDSDRASAIEAGANHYVVKGGPPERLTEAIKH
jgi:DNA-binding NarL/FixJ family response regulator